MANKRKLIKNFAFATIFLPLCLLAAFFTIISNKTAYKISTADLSFEYKSNSFYLNSAKIKISKLCLNADYQTIPFSLVDEMPKQVVKKEQQRQQLEEALQNSLTPAIVTPLLFVFLVLAFKRRLNKFINSKPLKLQNSLRFSSGFRSARRAHKVVIILYAIACGIIEFCLLLNLLGAFPANIFLLILSFILNLSLVFVILAQLFAKINGFVKIDEGCLACGASGKIVNLEYKNYKKRKLSSGNQTIKYFYIATYKCHKCGHTWRMIKKYDNKLPQESLSKNIINDANNQVENYGKAPPDNMAVESFNHRTRQLVYCQFCGRKNKSEATTCKHCGGKIFH